MNVTLKLPDALCKSARHRAVDQGLSLSGWVAKMIEREVEGPLTDASTNLLDWIGDEELADQAFDPPSSKEIPREVEW